MPISPFMLEQIPLDHLLHIIKQLKLKDSEKERLTKLATVRDPGHMEALAAELAKLVPELIEEVASLYDWISRKSLHLYVLPALAQLTLKELVEVLRERLGVVGQLPFGERREVKTGRKDLVGRVLHLVVSEAHLDAVVRLKKPVSFTDEGERVRQTKDLDVNVRVHLTRDDRLCEVYADYYDSKKALATLLGWLLKSAVPRRSGEEQSKFFGGLLFKETHTLKVSQEFGGRSFMVHGKDPEKVVSEQRYIAPLKGTRREALNFSHAKLKAHAQRPNLLHGFEFDITHAADGYVEIVQATFNFRGKQPKVVFPRRTSREAVDRLVANLTKHVSAG